MTTTEIMKLQAHVGAEPDGFWGNKSIRACQKHLKSLMPIPIPWPEYKDLEEFYGEPGENLMRIAVEGLGVEYDGKKVGSILVNEKCADSLLDILIELHDLGYHDILSKYGGCFNNRKMRSGSLPSVHAYGAAIDLDPANNGNRSHWPIKSTMPIGVMEVFSKFGWISAGAFWGRDAMHFQACNQM